MRTLKQIYYLFALMLLLPIGLVLRLLGWRPDGDSGVHSHLEPETRGASIVSSADADIDPYPYVYVNEDGSVRELHQSERKYLETPFVGADGGRPYVKWRYKQKSGWGDLRGFLKRSRLPSRIDVDPAPLEDPERAWKEERIHRLREAGYEVIERNGDFKVAKPNVLSKPQ